MEPLAAGHVRAAVVAAVLADPTRPYRDIADELGLSYKRIAKHVAAARAAGQLPGGVGTAPKTVGPKTGCTRPGCRLPTALIWTDGSSAPDGGAGWGAVIRHGGRVYDLCGWVASATSQRMELAAIVHALEALPEPCCVVVRSDNMEVLAGARSVHVVGISGVRRSVNMLDLWVRLDVVVIAGHHIAWAHVRGHANSANNQRADALAGCARTNRITQLPTLDRGDA